MVKLTPWNIVASSEDNTGLDQAADLGMLNEIGSEAEDVDRAMRMDVGALGAGDPSSAKACGPQTTTAANVNA